LEGSCRARQAVSELAWNACRWNGLYTGFRGSWQNGVAEWWVGNCRRDLLDHVIVINERHLKRLMNEYVRYYHEDRTHLGLGKQTPSCREAATDSDADSRVVAMPRLGGLHHRYDLAA
jgi:putative transposase